MITTGNKILFGLFVFCIFITCKRAQKSVTIKNIRTFNDYPSGSGMAHHDGQLYIIGDDASHLLVTDTLFNRIDSIQLFPSPEKRIPKKIKADLEAISVIRIKNKPAILLIGSGSLSPFRNFCWLIDPVTKLKEQYNLDTFYNRLRNAGITDLNIEGVTSVQGEIVLSSRGNKSFPKNFLIFTSSDFWRNQDSAEIRMVKIGVNKDSSFFNGVSGLDYSYRSDRLLLTVTTENTYSSHGDGEIGKSYLWFINNISSKKRYTAINPDRIIDLGEIDSRFKAQKIESVAIHSENKNTLELFLASDDDKGRTVLFSISVPK